MKNLFVFSLLFLFAISTGSPVLATPGSEMPPRGEIYTKVGGLKIPFIKHEPPNGDNTVKFSAATAAATIFVENGALTYLVAKKNEPKAGWALREKPLGSKATQVEGLAPSPTKMSFFKGKEPRNWRVALPAYEELTFGELYDHIRLNVKAHGKNVEKIFIVENGGDPEKIALQIEGAKKLSVNSEGELEIETGIGLFKMTAPIAYQEIDGRKVKVAAAYELKASEFQETDPRHVYGFKVGAYDKTKPLIIDPLLAWTFVGGTQEDKAYAIALDSDKNVFVTGTTRSSAFPVTPGAYDNAYASNLDIFVSKFDADLTTLLASTFIGGSGNDYGYSIAIGADGNIYIAGDTDSSDFPTTAGAYQGTKSGYRDTFVSKLDNDLSSLLASTFVGGSGNDYGRAITIDSAQKVFVTGYTDSDDFPTTAGAYQTARKGNEDAFIYKLDNTLSSLEASTYLGGSDSDYAYGLAKNGDVFVVGATASADFPTTTSRPYGGEMDAFIGRLNSNLTSLVASTYLGGDDHDVGKAIAISAAGDVYVTGWTASTAYYYPSPPDPGNFVEPTFPTTPGAYDRSKDPAKVPSHRFSDVFVSKFNSYLSVLMASTLLGGYDGEEGNAIALDSFGNVFVTGWTASEGDPYAEPIIPPFPTTQGAYDSTLNGEEDVFVVQFDPNLSTLLSSTNLGGESHDIAQGIALDDEVNVYLAGSTYSHDFPRAPVFIPYSLYDYSGSWDAFITKFTPDFLTQYLLSITKGGTGEGTVTSSPTGIDCGSTCQKPFNYNLKVKLTAAPKENSVFDETSWTGGCVVEDPENKPWECTATMLSDLNIGVQFILKTYTIQATANTGGTISPTGSLTVQYGATQSFAITPDANSYLADVIVDGSSVTPAPPKYGTYTYTFTNVTSNRTIQAVFRPNPVIQTTADPGGTILPSGTVTVQYDATQSFTITPNAGYALADLLVDGASVLTEPKFTTYIHTLTNVTTDHAIRAVFRPNPVIATAANSGGTISPVGPVTVQYGGSQSFSITPDSGNYLADLIVDGVSVTPTPPKYGTYIHTFTNVTSDRTIRAVFNPNPVVQTIADTGGSILPVGPVTVQYDATQTFTITPNVGYALVDLLVDGVSVLTEPKYAAYTHVLSNITTNRTIRAIFRSNPSIQTAVNAGGTISPVGPVTVQYGGDQNFSITPSAGYYLADVIVDGVSVAPAPPKYGTYIYTFSNVTSDRTIRVVFNPNPVVQTVADAGGTILPAGPVTVQYGASQNFTITPNAGHALADLLVDGVSVLPEPKYTSYTHTLTNIISDRTIRAIFRPNPLIQTTVSAGGTISPVGPVTVQYGGSQSFSITPNAGYYLADVMVDGNSVTPSPPKYGTYVLTLTNVTSDRTIRAVFQPNPIIQTTADSGGSIFPVGPVSVQYGENITFTINPNSGYSILDVIVDGISKGPLSTWTFTNVTSDRSIRAVFRPSPVIRTIADTGGTIFPPGPLTINYGGSQSFTIIPDAGYYIYDVLVNGASVGAVSTYTFTNVTSDQTIRAIFRHHPVIKASVSGGGTISPSGDVTVTHGGNQSFSIAPNLGYYLADVVVDGNSVIPAPPHYGTYTYSFTNVTSDRTIMAVFRPEPTVAIIQTTGGTIYPDTTLSVRYGSDLLISVFPDPGYFLTDVIIDGISIGPFAGHWITDIREDHSVRAIFTQVMSKTPYAIIATAGPGGTIRPFGIQNVKPLKSKTFTIKASKGYHISDVIVDGLSKGPISKYSFQSVTASHTIEAVFDTKKTLTIGLQGTGRGMVISKPLGISCGKDCTEDYDTGELVLLIPRPAADSVFAGWSGGGCKGTDTCTVTMDDDLTVIATFTLK